MKTSIIEKYNSFPVEVKAGLWFLACSFLQKGISVITTPVFTRLLNTSEYGNYNVFQSWLSIFTIIISLQLSQGVYTQGLIKFSDKRKRFSSSLQGLTLILCLMWAVAYFVFHSIINRLTGLSTVQMVFLLLLIWTTSVFNFWAAEQRVYYKYKTLVILTLTVSLLQPVFGIVFVILAEDKVTARILSILLIDVIAYTGLFIKQMYNGKKFFDYSIWKYALLFNLPLIPHYLSQTVLNNADRIMIKDMIGASEAGIYGLAYSISLVMTLFNTALMQTLSPWIYQKIKDNKITDVSGITNICLVLIAVVNIVLIAVAPEVVSIFAPKEYYAAIWIIPPVAMSVIFMFSYDLFAKFEFYYEKTMFIMVASVVGAVLNIILNYFFLSKLGYFAAAYTTLICYIIYAFAHFVFMRKICKEEHPETTVYNAKTLIVIYLSFLGIGFIFMATYNTPIIRYVLIFFSITALFVCRKRIRASIKDIIALKEIN